LHDLPLVVVLTGPTGVGKTEISLALAKKMDAEIISADSMQVYRGMDISTAKVSVQEQLRVPHHLIDILDPSEEFSIATYQKLARKAISDINERGKAVLMVGGSGLYLRAALHPYDLPAVTASSKFRHVLLQRAQNEGSAVLHQELSHVDSQTAARLHPNDAKRIIRALEVFYHTGRSISTHEEFTRNAAPVYRTLWYGLNRDRSELYRRIEARVDEMINNGLIEEVKRIRDMLAGTHNKGERVMAAQAIGYKELLPYLNQEEPLESAVSRIKQESRRFARRQLIWFRAQKEIYWYMLNDTDTAEDIAEQIAIQISFDL